MPNIKGLYINLSPTIFLLSKPKKQASSSGINGPPFNTRLTYHPPPCIQALPTAKIQAPTGASPVAVCRQCLQYKAGEVPVLCRVGAGLRPRHIGVVRLRVERDRVELGVG